MTEGSNKIEEKIKSLRQVTKTDYEVPEDKVSEYTKRLFKNQDALTYYLIRERNLDIKTITNFKLGLSERGELAIPVFKKGNLIDFKFRTLPPEEKGFRRISGTESWVFNDEGIKVGKEKGEIFITEGEIDAMSIWQAGFKNVISLVSGAGQMGSWIEQLDDIGKVYITLDSDSVGKKAARSLSERIGIERCINVVLTEKDANDFFKKYSSKDFENIVKNSTTFPIEDVTILRDLFEEIRNNPKDIKDYFFPYEELQKLTGGFSRENLITLSAPTSHGKSTFIWNIFVKLAKKGYPVMYLPLEDRMKFFVKRLLNIVNESEINKFESDTEWDELKEKIQNLPFYIYTGYEKFDLTEFEKIVEKGKKLYGIDIFAIDHLHFLARKGGGDITQEIGSIVRELVTLSRKYNISIFLVVQLRKKQASDSGFKQMPHYESMSDSIKIAQDSHMIIMLFKDFDNVTGRPFIQLAVHKNREGAITFGENYITYDYDEDTGIIMETGVVKDT